jgi:signal peptidase II
MASRLLSGRPPVRLLGGALRLGLAENPGAFLGLGDRLPEGARLAVFVAATSIALAGALAWVVSRRDLSLRRSLAAATMIGGGLANLLDRLPDGRVTDFLILSAGPLRTGVFNLADVAIVAGALGWLLPPRGREKIRGGRGDGRALEPRDDPATGAGPPGGCP